MKYLCLGYLDVERFDPQPEAAKMAVLSQCGNHCATMREAGRVIAEAGLEPTRTPRQLARHILYTEGKTPEALRDEALALIAVRTARLSMTQR